MNRCHRLAVAALALALYAAPAVADPFAFTVTINGVSNQRSFTSAEDAVNALEAGNLRALNPSYTDLSPANADILFRGIPVQAAFAANSTALRFVVPGTGLDRTFIGATRDESVELLRRFFEGQGGAAELTRILRFGVRTTAADPIAGNPTSAMNRAVARDFDAAFSRASGGGGASLGVRFGSFSGAGFSTQTLDLPIGYAWQISDDDLVEIDVPVSATDTEGARSYGANVGVRYRRRVTPEWTLQPSFRIGGAGSLDLASGSGLYSLALNSTYNWQVNDDWRITVGNGITYVATFPISVGRYSIDYDLKNIVFRNGVAVTYQTGLQIAGLATAVSAFMIDTRFTGDAVFIRSYQEFGVTGIFGTTDPIRVGVTGLVGDRGTRGFYFNAGMSF